MTNKNENLYGIILAAGQGKRIQGRIKALLKINKKTFVEKIITSFVKSGIKNILLVVGYKHKSVINYLKKNMLLSKVAVVINKKIYSQQIESLKLAIKSLPETCEGIMFLPVDYPIIKISTYKKLVSVWKKNKTKIVLPSYNYRKGHPTIFPKNVYKKILNKKIQGGARSLINNNKVVYVCVKDKNIVKDFDYLKDLNDYNKKII